MDLLVYGVNRRDGQLGMQLLLLLIVLKKIHTLVCLNQELKFEFVSRKREGDYTCVSLSLALSLSLDYLYVCLR